MIHISRLMSARHQNATGCCANWKCINLRRKLRGGWGGNVPKEVDSGDRMQHQGNCQNVEAKRPCKSDDVWGLEVCVNSELPAIITPLRHILRVLPNCICMCWSDHSHTSKDFIRRGSCPGSTVAMFGRIHRFWWDVLMRCDHQRQFDNLHCGHHRGAPPYFSCRLVH